MCAGDSGVTALWLTALNWLFTPGSARECLRTAEVGTRRDCQYLWIGVFQDLWIGLSLRRTCGVSAWG